MHTEPVPEAEKAGRSPALLNSSLAGLLGASLIAAAAAWLVAGGTVRPPFQHPMVTSVSFVVFGAFSLAEVPIMVFAMRRLLVERPENRRAVTGLNAVYVLFAAVYALPLFFLTGALEWAWLLSALALLRFATSLLFVRVPRP